MKLNPNLILRQVGKEYMIVNPFSDTIDMAEVYSMNDIAAWIWEQLENKEFTAEDMVTLLCDEYEVDVETARQDAGELCQQWVEAGLAVE